MNEKELFEKGLLCPKCKHTTNTYRHMFAKRWCPDCGFVLKEEGDQTPYNYKKALKQIKKEK